MFAASKTGSGSAGPANYVEDVFSTYLYTGTGASQTITNGIDLAGKGGLVWVKGRTSAWEHKLTDTVRGATKALISNTTGAETTDSNGLTSFSTTGFVLGSDTNYNWSGGGNYVSWTFRKQPKFFDVLTYTGTGGGPSSVAHALGSVPGCVIIKSTSRGGNWVTVSRMSTGNYAAFVGSSSGLQSTAAADSTTYNLVGAGAVTSTTFDPSWWNANGTVGAVNNICDNGVTYVAYLFAHDAGGFGLTGTDNVISCGSFTTDGSGNSTVNLGYEPQWIITKRTDSTSNWIMQDNMRGLGVLNSTSAELRANTSQQEFDSTGTNGNIFATGFNQTGLQVSATYIYIAIRRGPMKTPTTGTSVFSPVTFSFDSFTTAGFPVDFLLSKQYTTANDMRALDRLRGCPAPPSLFPSLTNSELQEGYWKIDNNTGVNNIAGGTIPGYENWMFRRAPGFFDVVCYTGTGVAGLTITHNLQSVPELIIIKARDTVIDWAVYSATLGNTQYLRLNTTNASTTSSLFWNNTSPTATTFTLGISSRVNNSSSNIYVAYLFATCPGVSKVGSYTGTGALQTINCGFAAGARFVLIKRTDSTGDWFVWDSARGISSGNDPYLLLNSSAAEVTGTNYVDTTAVGFQVTAAAPAELNANGGTYIFLAIA